ncbi:LicD family protein [Treponema bryantii]|uniref:LicD family protein n=1 Tax=Treponema bryantii TaxID=163 RepID=UPI0003B3CC86|nr:LicD family protein [Treponema bryantii]
MNLYIVKKAFRKIFRPLYKILTSKKILKAENEELKYQLNYLKNHINPDNIKPATGILREYQLAELKFLDEVMKLLKQYNITPFFDGGCLLGYCRHKGFVPWDDDIDLGLMRQDFDRLLKIMKNEMLFFEMNSLTDLKHPFSSIYDKIITENPGKIAVVLSTTCIHIFKGTSLKDAVNVEIFPYDYVRESVTEEEYYNYKEKSKKKIQKLKNFGLKKIFDFYEQELNAENSVFSKEKTNKITDGLGNFAFIEYKFRGFLKYDELFPLKETKFEGVNIYVPNNPERALQCIYGDYMRLPNDIGIAHSIEDINAYLKDKGQDIIDYREKF